MRTRCPSPRTGPPRRVVVAIVGVMTACGLVGCAAELDSSGNTVPPTVPDPLEALGEQKAGTGAAVIGIEQLSFLVTYCGTGPAEGDPPEAAQEYRLEGKGTTSDGTFAIQITRYRSDTGAGTPVVTETARVQFGEGDKARGLEAARSTAGAGGEWLDLTDPAVHKPLLRRRANAIDIRARFGPENAREGDAGIVEGRLRATCPP